MPITQSLSSKGNVKKNTNQDLPFNPAQPVINSFYAVSTAGQTSIANLGFTVDTVNNPDVFFLFVDGKKLRLGTGNDYVFAAVAADGTSSSITLNQSLPVNLNIQAYKLGLKPEVQFAMDNRFTQLYAAQGSAFQGFVSQTDFAMTATTTTGTPAAGTFYSTIPFRASMIDLSQDLKVRMGVERIMVQQLMMSQTEFGPNGEPVWFTPNDTFGQIRFVGPGWNDSTANSSILSEGPRLSNSNLNDYVEVTFYGTGLNWIIEQTNSSVDFRASVDGGSEGSNLIAATPSSVLSARNYSTNQPISVFSGLNLGIHTVKIRLNTGAFRMYGFEILNESTSIKTNPGVAYNKGQSIVTAAQSALSYSAPVTGSVGGRVVVYQTSAGTIAQVFQAVNVAQANLTVADHTNEEVARKFNWREFGAGRADDFSGNFSASSNLAFTLDDGTTTLVGSNVSINTSTSQVGPNASGAFLSLTFIGTGLDIERLDDGALASTFAYSIDGTTIGTISTAQTSLGVQKIVSGLPYGTHTFKILRSGATGANLGIRSFIVYQPKKPAIPAGSVELADYNVLATYVSNGTAGTTNISTGVIRKQSIRESVYVGSPVITGIDPANFASGIAFNTATNADYTEYTFFGTGVNWRTLSPPAAATYTVSLQSITTGGALSTFNTTNFPAPAAAATAYGNLSFSGSTGVITAAGTQTPGAGLNISGLALGLYKIRITKTTGTNMYFDSFDVIAPIHSYKSNIYADLQNTLSVGNQSLSDNRKTTAIKDSLPATKSWAQALGFNQPTTTSSVFVPVVDMSLTINVQSGNAIDISYSIVSFNSGTGGRNSFQVYVDGIAVGNSKASQAMVANEDFTVSDRLIVPVSKGVHKVDVYWKATGGTGNLEAQSTFVVREI